MAINIDDSLKERAINILNNEQDQLDGSFDKQSIAGKSPGMESEHIKDTSFLTREEVRITQNADGTWSQTKIENKNKYYDEGVVDDKEKEFKENAETLREVCKAFDDEIIRLNGLINAKKLEIKSLSDNALSTGCSTFSRGIGIGIGTTALLTWNNDAEFIQIYTKMAGPGVDYGTDNPFEPDQKVILNSTYSGFGYKNVEDSVAIKVRSGAGNTSVTGIVTDGSGSNLGTVVIISETQGDHPAPANALSCVSYGSSIRILYDEILELRAERNSYRKKLNIIKDNKSEKELMYWGYLNTKTEKDRRKTKNVSAISAINDLDGQSVVEEGLILHFDAGDNSSYFGSGTTWYDISRDDYDDNGSIVGATYVENTLYPERSYFNFDGTADHVSFDINNSLFGNPTTVTVEMLAQLTIDETASDENGYLLFSWGNQQYSVWTGQKVANLPPALGYTTANGDLYGLTKQQVDSLQLNRDGASEPEDVLPGQWKHYIFEMRSDVSYTNNKIYINGVERSLQQLTDVGDPLNSWNPVLTPGMFQILYDPYKFAKIIDNDTWNGRVYSQQGYTTAFMSWSTQSISGEAMAGLTTNPTAATSFSTIDYAWYYDTGGAPLQIVEKGISIGSYGSYGSYDTNTVTSIIYDGEKVRYYKDGVLQREIDPTHGSNPLHFSSSTYSTGKTWSANFWEYTNDTTRTERVENRNFDDGSGTISNYSYEMPMELSLFRVYNRALTQEEININFEEVRSRFNL